jgi:hypothetical protein
LQPFLCSDFLISPLSRKTARSLLNFGTGIALTWHHKENQTEQCQNAYMYSIIFQRNKVTN